MVPPLTGGDLMIPAWELRPGISPTAIRSRRGTKEMTMTIRLVAMALLCLITGIAFAQEPKVTPLMSKDLPESPGREALMITVEHAPGGQRNSSAQCTCFCLRAGGFRCDAT